MSDELEGCIAVVPESDPRARWWLELFGGNRVPVKNDEPTMTIFPDESQRLCYFVDFSSCDWLKPRLEAALARRPKAKNGPTLQDMLKEDIYPIIADGVIVIRAPLRLLKGPELG